MACSLAIPLRVSVCRKRALVFRKKCVAQSPAESPQKTQTVQRRALLVQLAGVGGSLSAVQETHAQPLLSSEPKGELMQLALDGAIGGTLSTVRTVTAALCIVLILLQNPQSDEASEALAKGSSFGSMKQSTNFLTILTWGLISTFIATSALLAM